MAAAVILSDAKSRQIAELKDSKLLTALQRERLLRRDHPQSGRLVGGQRRAGGVRRLGMHVVNVEALRHGPAASRRARPTTC